MWVLGRTCPVWRLSRTQFNVTAELELETELGDMDWQAFFLITSDP